ncbi:ARFD1 [Mytilus edulis]|uniref:RING-type E3 ubiquitin transferase n=1 Tax=Mytilus edulis TaxID=6550 RepID=A0A8S3USE7_MYTED|nr:ARFD1 [Mytilus edulis]
MNNQETTDRTILECRVCDDVFRFQGDKVPRLLMCGHTVCHQCLTRLQVHGTSILCPFDRQPTEIGDSGVWGLKKNFALLELLEKLQFTTQNASNINLFAQQNLDKEKELDIPCDENELHTAVLYCMTCSTHLCVECAELTHSTRTLARHKRVPLSEKPKENPKCPYHPMHLVEFACLEEDCKNNPLMCYICKDYGRHVKHRHSLLDSEAENVRTSITNAVQQIKSFGEEVADSARKLGVTIQQIEGGVQLLQSPDGVSSTQRVPGTAEQSRAKIKQYFYDLRETLNRQEDAAKILLAKQDVKTLLETIQKQQQQFSDVPEQLPLDPAIPITFTKDNRVHIGPKIEMRVVTLGLDHAGKTSILFKLKQNEFIQTIPTIGFNVETIEYKNLKFTIWDVGGQHKIRPLWKHYYFNTQAVIYVIDSNNKDRLAEAQNELAKLVQEKELREASLLIFVNKQDIQPCVSIEEVTESFGLFKLCCNRSWHIQACDANSGNGLKDGLEWLSRQMVAAGATDLA